jgi:hypothetical protein
MFSTKKVLEILVSDSAFSVGSLNPEPLNPEPLNPEPLNPEHEPLEP